MKHFLRGIFALLILHPALSFAQSGAPAAPTATPAPANPFMSQKSPQDTLPGIILRVCMGMDGKYGTPIVVVAQNGDDYNLNYKALAVAELNKLGQVPGPQYVATGYLILEQDTIVEFNIGDSLCIVAEKKIPRGDNKIAMKKGKFKIELGPAHGKGQGGFTIFDAVSGKSVLFYTPEMLERELNRSYPVNGKTFKSWQVVNSDPLH